MSDRAHNKTDKLLAELEKRLEEIYEQAGQSAESRAATYFKKFAELDAKKAALVADGKLSIEEYIRWRENKILYGEHWKRLKNDLALDYLSTNRTALAYLNGIIPQVYTLNYNYSLDDIARQVSDLGGAYHFELTDAHTVKNLAVGDKTLLPYKYVDGSKDVRWNTQKVNSAVLQGILAGDSVPNLAKRLRTVTEMNRTSSIRNARTTVTGAECKGRQDSYERAEADGIRLRREWMAAIDGRTRHAHRLLDGQLADTDKPFKSELGDIMYPGDPHADPSNVYNCRCTIVARVVSIGEMNVDGEGSEGREYADRRTAQDFYNEDPEKIDKMQKMLYNETADKNQHALYKKRLGSEVPGRFSDFQKLKYEEAEKYQYLVGYYRYKGYNPQSNKNFYDANLAMKRLHADRKIKTTGTLVYPAKKYKIQTFDSHAAKRADERGLTKEWAQGIVNSADFAVKQRKGTQFAYYNSEGMAVVDLEGVLHTLGTLDEGGELLYKEALEYIENNKSKGVLPNI